MFQGFLTLGGQEVLNSERTATYAGQFVPLLGLRDCEACDGMSNALGTGPYTNPTDDEAPWFRVNDPDTANFYGFYPLAVQGIEDSSSTVTVTEFTYDGGFQSRPRHSTKQVRVRGVLVGLDRDAAYAGLRWLRSILDIQPCGRGYDCQGREIVFFTNCPGADTVEAAEVLAEKYRRTMYRVEVLDSLRVVRQHTSRSGAIIEVEFVLSAGVPWSFTDIQPAVTSTGLTGTPASETDCPPMSDAYDSLVMDPADPVLSRPPSPPSVYVMDMPADWVRYTAVIPASTSDRWGRLTPVIHFTTGANPLNMVRVRFYQDPDGAPGLNVPVCDYEGDFLMTYMPAQSHLTIDGIRRDVRLNVGGRDMSGTHLVVGSQGRPPTWPSLGCDTPYLVVIDADNALTANETVRVDVAVGE